MAQQNVSLENIYLDFVAWGLIPSDFDSLKHFFEQPTWLTIKIWNHYQKNQSQILQQQSITVAKLTNCIVSIANSFSGDKNNNTKFDDYTLFKFSVFDENDISYEAIEIYQQCVKKNLIADFILKSFACDNKLVQAIKEKSDKE